MAFRTWLPVPRDRRTFFWRGAAPRPLPNLPTVQVALPRLAEDYRQVLTLRFGLGLRVPEVAASMHRSPEQVRVLQFRALRALQRELQPRAS